MIFFAHSAPENAIVSQHPGFDGALPSKHYAGYVTVDENHGRKLYYYYVLSERNPSEDPVVLWLNGGPGCSSFDGFVYEHGSCRNANDVRFESITSGDEYGDTIFVGAKRTKGVWGRSIGQGNSSKGKEPEAIKKSTIVKGFAKLTITNLGRITAEKLVQKARKIKLGTKKESGENLRTRGKTNVVLKKDRYKHMRCSIANNLCPGDQSLYVWSSNERQDLLLRDKAGNVCKWFKIYLEYLSNPFFIAGESYAGVYVPMLSYEVVKGLDAGDEPTLNFKGYMVGNGVTDEVFDDNALVPFARGMGLISNELYEGSGHTVPEYKPKEALALYSRWLEGKKI
ncbi:hypothetical protein L1987_04015 [Smallanthus sonchifolius]|uniref:Uncharacterized protein n=2 Tax=Smallanthus sonchifolius TaxID=185202 RepID=A0ACB9KCD6_9ASTR|nr:hypothetical protein L1987_04014 [Smallanthus sonchifolius]KAI3829884.1 hypothetical protein L1987_04015 [Smallanthus sonchifolius]